MIMDSVSIKDLRNNLAQLIEEVAIGKKKITITKFGKKKAVLVPVTESKRDISRKTDWTKLPAFGIWKNRKDIGDTASWVADLRKKESYRLAIKK